MTELPPLTPEQQERLARYRAGAFSDAERAAFELEALASPSLSEELYSELALDSVAPLAAAARRASPLPIPMKRVPAPRVLTWLPAAAAILVVAALGWWLAQARKPRPIGDVLRGAPSAPRALYPVGPVAAVPESLRWNLVPHADHYRVELFDVSGRTLGVTVTAETSVAVGAMTHVPLAAGEWRVVPIDSTGREEAPLPRATFGIAPPGR